MRSLLNFRARRIFVETGVACMHKPDSAEIHVARSHNEEIRRIFEWRWR